ncbi:MAG TPA: hypothetical protein VKU00_11120 [Chthonomonadaceae bacterium]|nr:hypothetical protein [Chthonomonadaceae bacterium]
MPFMPQVGDIIEYAGCQYVFPAAHPGSDLPLEMEGGRATVTRVQRMDDGSFWALKVFKYRYRTPEQATMVDRLATICHLPGLQAAQQILIPPFASVAQQEPDLCWAVLMPWIEGATWGEVLGRVQKGERRYSPEEALELARTLLKALVALERERIVHCDLSGGNVILTLSPEGSFRFQLIDLEDMVIREHMPASFTPGSPGYALPGVERTACAEGDRFAGAILVAEALALGLPHAADLVSGEGVLRGNRNHKGARIRFESILYELKTQQPEFAELLARAWRAQSLRDCASLAELSNSLCEVDIVTPEDEEGVPFETTRKYLADLNNRVVDRVARTAIELKRRVESSDKPRQTITGLRNFLRSLGRAIRPGAAKPDRPAGPIGDPSDFDGATAGMPQEPTSTLSSPALRREIEQENQL